MNDVITNDEYAEGNDHRYGDKEDAYGPLRKAVASSYRSLQPYRKTVLDLTKEYAGPLYGMESGDEYRSMKYINLLKQAVSSYMTLLSSNRPRALVSTPELELRPFAAHFQEGINRLIEEIKIEDVVSHAVRDAFFWVGIVKVHMADTGRLATEEDIAMDPGMPFASNIALDDFFWDTNARKMSECRYAGDIYRMPLETLKNSDQYSGDILDDLTATSKYGGSQEDLAGMAFGHNIDPDELEPMADVCDIWLPREGKVKTFVVRSRSELTIVGDPIAEYDWEGKELGPYKLLHFDEVSQNVLPCSTAADLYPLDLLINNIYSKQAQKAKRHKTNPIYTPAGADDAERVRDASDGEWVSVQDPSQVNVLESGGVNANLQGFMLNSINMFDRMAGNLQAMMGLGAQTDTVGQEKLVHGAASRREGQLQTSVLRFTTSLVEDLAFLLWQDNYTELPNRVEVDEVPGVSYDATWRPDDREGEFESYDFSIDIYSMQYQGPSERIAKINELLSTIYVPLMPYIQEQGGTVDLAKLAELHGDMLDLPRLRQIVMFNTPPVESSRMDSARKSPVSNRNYTRRSVSEDGGSSPDADQWIQQESKPQT